jgi:hypothetical protein
LKTLPAEAVGLLSTFVKAGGGLFLFGGEALASSRFNAEFAGLLPVQVGEPVKADEELPWRIGDFDRTSPIFGVFTLEGGGTPGTAEFTRRHGVQPGVTATVLARFDDGIPFLLGATAGLFASQFLVGLLTYVSPTGNTPVITWVAQAVAVVFSAGVGITAGLIPAIKAARLEPIQALRYE